MTLFVDKLDRNNLGGLVKDLKKAEYIFAYYGLSFEKFLSEIPQTTLIPAGMFHAGKYVVAFNFNRELTLVNLAFINYEINIEQNFDAFADTLSPKSVAGFHKMQEIIKKKTVEDLNDVELSEDNGAFEINYGKYLGSKINPN